jgi:hypothetical protein
VSANIDSSANGGSNPKQPLKTYNAPLFKILTREQGEAKLMAYKREIRDVFLRCEEDALLEPSCPLSDEQGRVSPRISGKEREVA